MKYYIGDLLIYNGKDSIINRHLILKSKTSFVYIRYIESECCLNILKRSFEDFKLDN